MRIGLHAYPAPAFIIPTKNVTNRVLTNSKNLPIDKRLTAIFQTLVFFRNLFEIYFIQNGSCSFLNAILTEAHERFWCLVFSCLHTTESVQREQ